MAEALFSLPFFSLVIPSNRMVGLQLVFLLAYYEPHTATRLSALLPTVAPLQNTAYAPPPNKKKQWRNVGSEFGTAPAGPRFCSTGGTIFGSSQNLVQRSSTVQTAYLTVWHSYQSYIPCSTRDSAQNCANIVEPNLDLNHSVLTSLPVWSREYLQFCPSTQRR